MPDIYSAYSPPPAVYVDTSDLPDMCDQSFAQECDINYIISKYPPETHYADPTQPFITKPVYGDYSDDDYGNFQFAQNMVIYGKQLFMLIPSSVREQFNNDPEQFLAAYDANPDQFTQYLSRMVVTSASTTIPVTSTMANMPTDGSATA